MIQVEFILVLQTLEQVGKTEGYLMDRILMQVIFSLAKAGYPQHIEDIRGRIRFERELIPGMFLQQSRETTLLKFFWLGFFLLFFFGFCFFVGFFVCFVFWLWLKGAVAGFSHS